MLLNGIRKKEDGAEELLWQTVLAHQGVPFYTASGLAFSYTVKRRRDGAYSGELLVSRREESKTLTKSSVLLAFHRILDRMEIRPRETDGCVQEPELSVPEYRGPKAIGQIFGISYLYSLFWRFGLIRVPEKVEEKLRGGSVKQERDAGRRPQPDTCP